MSFGGAIGGVILRVNLACLPLLVQLLAFHAQGLMRHRYDGNVGRGMYLPTRVLRWSNCLDVESPLPNKTMSLRTCRRTIGGGGSHNRSSWKRAWMTTSPNSGHYWLDQLAANWRRASA
ncbi:hypothetical protein GGR56DRAFT_504345 [Xylariaceae sp. FL0804]|nr:hypothetical protein GGR56DRAFT_504345 [Xylariaceae sp. FL0804]